MCEYSGVNFIIRILCQRILIRIIGYSFEPYTLSIADQLCYKPHPEIEKKVEELVSDTRLTALSLYLLYLFL